jgi:phage terminase large subunit-like protein
MPRRLITAPDHSRSRSLGNLVTWWIETFTVHGPGAVVGQRVSLTDEYFGFLLDAYALSPIGRRLYDSGFLSRPKGCDKSGLAAKIALAEAFGPVRFAGWAKGGETYEFLGRVYRYSKGEPMGRTVKSPFVRILATEEEQTGNTFATIHYNLTDSRAPLFDLQAWGVVPGLSKVVIPGGGSIVRSTAGAASKDGGLETFAVFDETHLYITPQLREMYNTVTENLGKRAMDAEPWFLETTTMFGPGEESVAERTIEYSEMIEEGLARKPRALIDHRWGEISDKDFRDEAKLADAFREAYGDAIAWNPVEYLIERAYDPRRPVARTRRYRLNAVTASENAWLQPEDWSARGIRARRGVAQRLKLAWDFVRPWRGDKITLGFDGSLTNDATALIACRVKDRYLFPLHIQQKPDTAPTPNAPEWEVDQAAVDAAVAAAFKKFKVVGFYADPPYWQDFVRTWDKEHGDALEVKAGPKNAIAWYTKRDVQMAAALELLETAISSGTMAHDDDSKLGRIMTRHFLNARRWERRGGTVIGKEKKNSPKKIDAAVAGALAFQACADYLAKKPVDEPDFVPFAVR